MRVKGKTAIVTGASSGIGRETARELARQGANIVLASRNRDALELLAFDIAGADARVLVVPTDVTDRLAVEALVRRTVEEFGSIDVLVNNAGIGLMAPIVGGSVENMRRLFDVNFWGAVHCIQSAVPFMLRQKRGHIVNVSSVAGKIAPPYMGIYAASKFALGALSDSLRSELAGSGVGVSTVYPGLTRTSFTENMLAEVEAPSIPPLVRAVHPAVVARRIAQAIRWGLRDVYVSPQDVAAVGTYTVAPAIVDWAMRMFMGRPLIPAEEPLPGEGAPDRNAQAGAESEPT
jgi:short-subunit dehydrogenase